MMRYVSIGRQSVLPSDVFACYLSNKRPSLSDIKELASKGRLHTTDDDMVLLVRNPTLPPTRPAKPNSVGRAACLLNDEPVRIYVPLLMRPLDHASLSLDGLLPPWHHAHVAHAGAVSLWIGMNVCTRWWLRHCLKCQARKSPRLTVRWPIIPMPPSEGSGVAVSVDYFGPRPVTS